MTDLTSLSTPQLQPDAAESSKPDLPTPKVGDFNPLDIPHFPTTTFLPVETKEKVSTLEPSLCTTQESNSPTNNSNDIGRFEYEFSFRYTDHLSFVYLYDSSDVSACERVIHRPVKQDEITYSESNGFITDGDFKFTFKKSPFKQTYVHTVPTTEYHESVRVPPKRVVAQSAADVLASL